MEMQEKHALHNKIVFVPVDERKMVPLRIQVLEEGIAFLVPAGKGEMGEAEALFIIASVQRFLAEQGIPHEAMTRETGGAERIDQVRIPFQKGEEK